MAKRTKKLSRPTLKLEALEQRQLLAGITGSGTDAGSDIHHANGNVYDQVLLTGTSVKVTNDDNQVTRVSFLDLNGDIVQAEFSGKGTLTVALDSDTSKANQDPTGYNQTGVKYMQGLASFTIEGSDASTNFQVFSVGKGNAINQSLFDATHTGGDHFADVQRLTIVANTANPNGSVMGSIRAGDALFSGSSGVVGITAANVQVQNLVRIYDIDAKGTATPALTFGTQSQFGSVEVLGGDLVQTNLKAISNSDSYAYQLSSGANVDSAGNPITAKSLSSAVFTTPIGGGTSNTFSLTTAIDNLNGTSNDDVFNASHTSSSSVVSALDTINGNGGNDTLNIADSTGDSTHTSTAPIDTLTVSNVESFVYTSTGGLGASDSLDTSGWTGLKSTVITLQDTANNSGGTNAYTAAGDTAVVINSRSSADTGAWELNGGSTVKLTNSAGGAAGVAGNVAVTGVEGTTSVDVTLTGKGGTGKVDVTDWATGADDKDKTGTIKTVTLNGVGADSKIDSNALTNLSLTGIKDVKFTITDELAAHAASGAGTTLAVNLNNVTGTSGIKDDIGTLKQVDLTVTGKDSVLDVNANSKNMLSKITVGGDKALTLTVTGSGSNYKTLTSTNTAGLTASVNEAVAVTTGAGADKITITAATKNAVVLGAGNDWVSATLDADAKLGSGGSLDGGDGTDTLALDITKAALAASTSTLTGKITSFEKLQLDGTAGAADINLHNLNDINYVVVNGNNTANVKLSHMSSGSTVEFKASQSATTTVDIPVAAIQNETLAVKLTGETVNVGSVDSGSVNAVALTSTDTNTDTGPETNTIALTSTSVKSVTVTGNQGTDLTVTGSVSTVDASALSKGVFTLHTSSNLGDATIKGASGLANSITVAVASGKTATITGGSEIDNVTVTGGGNATMDLGAKANVVTVSAGTNNITVGDGGNTITLDGGTNTVTAGSGNDTINIGAVGASTINVGSGTDTVVFKAGAQTGQTGGYFVTLAGIGKGDKINLAAIDKDAADNAGADVTTFNSTELVLGQGVSFSDFLNEAAKGDHSGGSLVRWFRYNSDTYIVIDNGAADTFTAGTDMVVKLTGSINLAGGTAANLTNTGTAILTI